MEAVCLFSPTGGGELVRADAVALNPPCEGVLGLRLPHLVTLVPPLVVGESASGGVRGMEALLSASLGVAFVGKQPTTAKGQQLQTTATSAAAIPAESTRDPLAAYSRFPKLILRDFTGCSDDSETERKALTDFALHCARGDMDAAYTCIRGLPNLGAIWENMAHGSITGRKLDVARVALGQMGHARGVKALREAIAKETAAFSLTGTETEGGGATQQAPLGSPPHLLALLSLHLGRVKDAARFYREAGRADLLNRCLQECGQWENAIALAGQEDRVHLRATHSAHAKSLELDGNVQGALDALRASDSDSSRLEGCRILVEAKDYQGLEAWVEECLKIEEGGGRAVSVDSATSGAPEDSPDDPSLVGSTLQLPGYAAGTGAGVGEGGGSSSATATTAAAAAVMGGSTLGTPSVVASSPVGRWYAQFCEAQGLTDKAAMYYRRVGDSPALLRLYVASGDLQGAIDIATAANAPNNTVSPTRNAQGVTLRPLSAGPAAAFLLARHLEGVGDPQGAMHWYTVAGRFSHAVRCAGVIGKEGEVLALASRAGPATQLSVARNLESQAVSALSGGATTAESTVKIARAVKLYHSAGSTARAMELCLCWGLWDELGGIAGDLAASPEIAAVIPAPLLTRTSEAFTAKGLFAGAVGLLVAGKRWGEALDMTLTHTVPLTDALAEALTPPKPRLPAGTAEESAASSDPVYAAAVGARNNHLLRLAGALKKQGLFHCACKKYTQAGDKVRAMKALLLSGDVEKIVFFAGVCRSKEIYILAANFLQTLPWHVDAEILKHILEFYTKAKAYEQLSAFYEACSSAEIDEFRNYEKAAAALREAAKVAAKIKEEALKDAKLQALSGACVCARTVRTATQLYSTAASLPHEPPP